MHPLLGSLRPEVQSQPWHCLSVLGYQQVLEMLLPGLVWGWVWGSRDPKMGGKRTQYKRSSSSKKKKKRKKPA